MLHELTGGVAREVSKMISCPVFEIAHQSGEEIFEREAPWCSGVSLRYAQGGWTGSFSVPIRLVEFLALHPEAPLVVGSLQSRH